MKRRGYAAHAAAKGLKMECTLVSADWCHTHTCHSGFRSTMKVAHVTASASVLSATRGHGPLSPMQLRLDVGRNMVPSIIIVVIITAAA